MKKGKENGILLFSWLIPGSLFIKQMQDDACNDPNLNQDDLGLLKIVPEYNCLQQSAATSSGEKRFRIANFGPWTDHFHVTAVR